MSYWGFTTCRQLRQSSDHDENNLFSPPHYMLIITDVNMISIGLDVVLNLHFAGLHYVPSWENVRLNILDSICIEVFLFVN